MTQYVKSRLLISVTQWFLQVAVTITMETGYQHPDRGDTLIGAQCTLDLETFYTVRFMGKLVG